MMKRSVCVAAILLLLLYAPLIISARQISQSHSRHGHSDPEVANTIDGTKVEKENLFQMEGIRGTRKKRKRGPKTLHLAGSRLPDCSHACGSCRPCRLVMVSFVCSSIQEAETCPMAYKCMCHNKSYPVP